MIPMARWRTWRRRSWRWIRFCGRGWCSSTASGRAPIWIERGRLFSQERQDMVCHRPGRLFVGEQPGAGDDGEAAAILELRDHPAGFLDGKEGIVVAPEER